MKKLLYLVLLIVAMSCSSNQKPFKDPDNLVIGFIIADDPAGTIQFHKLIAEYLKKDLKLKNVDTYSSTDYAAIVEAMKAKKVDIAYLGELSYVIAHERAGAESLLMYSLPDRPVPTGSVIITYPGSGLNSMEDVKTNSKKLTLLFSDPASTSGHLYPRDYLTKIGLDPESSFKQVSFANGHTASVLSIKSHKADLACTFKRGLERMERKGYITKSDYKILWTSGDYPSTPICIRSDLPESLKQKVKQSLLDLPRKDPKTWRAFQDKALIYYEDSIRHKIIMVPCCDSIYNPIRKIIKNAKNLNFGVK